ncbi:Tecrl [Acrasis kona]|uniref:Tecrl n=1 Tax=Acrasis kona TaxID=1008807 RepID=A0AAW2YJK7_9EUKA
MGNKTTHDKSEDLPIEELKQCSNAYELLSVLDKLSNSLQSNQNHTKQFFDDAECISSLESKIEQYALSDINSSVVLLKLLNVLNSTQVESDAVLLNNILYSSITSLILCSLRYYERDHELWTQACQITSNHSKQIFHIAGQELADKLIKINISAMCKFEDLIPDSLIVFGVVLRNSNLKVHYPTIVDSLFVIIDKIYDNESYVVQVFEILCHSTMVDATPTHLKTCLLVIQRLISALKKHKIVNNKYNAMIIDWSTHTCLTSSEIVDIIVKEELKDGIFVLYGDEMLFQVDAEPKAIRLLDLLIMLVKDNRTKKYCKSHKEHFLRAAGILLRFPCEEIQIMSSDLCIMLS